VETWSRRSKRITIFLWLASAGLIAGLFAVIIWFLVRIALQEGAQGRLVLITILCLPLPYLVYYFLFFKKGFSPLRRWRLARALRKVPADAHPRVRASGIWEWLPFRRRLAYGGIDIGLAPEKDPGWQRLAGANHDLRLATGGGFDILLLLKKGAFNFVSGELPGAGAWLAAPGGLVEEIDREQLMAAIVHELFHRDTGELKARRVALELQELGVFSTAFIFYYIFLALAFLSIPMDRMYPGLPLFALLILLLWVLIKIFAYWAVTGLFPVASCRAADAYAGNVTANPLVVAEAISKSLRYSLNHKDLPFLWSWQARGPARFMFVPVVRKRKLGELQTGRVQALRLEPSGNEGHMLPEVEEMNRKIGIIALEVDGDYKELRGRVPRRWAAAAAYLSIIAVIVVILAMSTGKNFLPVRLFVDWRRGGQNAAAPGPTGSGRTVIVDDSPQDDMSGGYSFTPDSLIVTVGETVTWVNDDDREHVIGGEGIPASPPLRPGDSYSVVFNRSGRFGYYSLEELGEPGTPRGEVFSYY